MVPWDTPQVYMYKHICGCFRPGVNTYTCIFINVDYHYLLVIIDNYDDKYS